MYLTGHVSNKVSTNAVIVQLGSLKFQQIACLKKEHRFIMGEDVFIMGEEVKAV